MIWSARGCPHGDRFAFRGKGGPWVHISVIHDIVGTEKEPTRFAAVLHAETQDCIEDKRGVYNDVRMAICDRITPVEVQRDKRHGQCRKQHRVTLQNRSSPMMLKRLTYEEVLKVTTLSPDRCVGRHIHAIPADEFLER